MRRGKSEGFTDVNNGNYELFRPHIDGLVQERRNSSALAMELRFSCANASVWALFQANQSRPRTFRFELANMYWQHDDSQAVRSFHKMMVVVFIIYNFYCCQYIFFMIESFSPSYHPLHVHNILKRSQICHWKAIPLAYVAGKAAILFCLNCIGCQVYTPKGKCRQVGDLFVIYYTDSREHDSFRWLQIRLCCNISVIQIVHYRMFFIAFIYRPPSLFGDCLHRWINCIGCDVCDFQSSQTSTASWHSGSLGELNNLALTNK